MCEDIDHDRGRIARLQSLKRRAKHLKWLEAEFAVMAPDDPARPEAEARLKEFRWTIHILMERSVSGLQLSKAH